MKNICSFFGYILFCCFSISSFAQRLPQVPLDPDFELSDLNSGGGTGWFTPKPEYMPDYAVKIVTDQHYSGTHAAQLSSTKTNPKSFGNVMQTFDAELFRGKKVHFKAAVKTTGRAQLWMRVDLNDRQMGFFDNMDDRPITDSLWKQYEIIGTVDNNARVINIGCMIIGEGEAYFDNVFFDVLDDRTAPVYENAAAKELSAQELANIHAFSKLFGYIRYFYPGDEAITANWNAAAINGMKYVESARNSSELASRLEEFFLPFAPRLSVSSENGRSTGTSTTKTAKKKTAWFHYGVGINSRSSIYISKRILSDGKEYYQNTGDDDPERYEVPGEMIAQFPSPDSLQSFDLGYGITAGMPISLYANDKGTLPHGSGYKRDTLEYGLIPSGDDRFVRLADVAIAWNLFQHFYPYFDVGSIDWKPVLDETLKAAATAKNKDEFTLVLQRMVAKLKDGHGNVYRAKDFPYSGLFYSTILEDKVIVTDLSKGYRGKLKVGDVITYVNGTPSREFVSARKQLISSATEQWSNYIVGVDLLGALDTSHASLTVLHADGSTEIIDEMLSKVYPSRPEPKLKVVHEVKPGIMYVNLDKITASMFDSSIEVLSKAKALIFDLRGYPRGIMTESISHLIDSTVWCAYWTIPQNIYPDQKKMMWDTSRWSITPQAPRFTKNIVHLTNGRAISAAETYMGIIEYYKIGEIIGSPTAGTNGNVNPFTLPGGYTVSWTGMRVIKHDGSRHHGVGIKPTIKCKPTLQGIRDGRDEVLEKAIEVVEGNMK